MRYVAALLTIALLSVNGLAQEPHVQLTADQVPIRFSASPTSQLVATGRKGDVFRLSGEKAGWFEIYLFSGEARYVAKAAAHVSAYKAALPNSVSRRQKIYRALAKAEDRAVREAEKKYPPSGRAAILQNIEYQRILDDRYKLDVMRQFGVQPPTYRTLNVEGAKARWR